MPIDIPKIIEGLQYLREADRDHAVFGADGHEYKLRPCATEAQVLDFERRYSLRLPEDYRRFLTEVGNGGAGPYYGILGVDQLCELEEDFWGDLSKPFPYRQLWNGPPELLKAIADADELDDEGERQGELIDEYWKTATRDGSIMICDYGCALRFVLVVNGPEFGHVWFDATADISGYSPVGIDPSASADRYGKWCLMQENISEEKRVSFADWYHCWLTWACRIVRDKNR